MAYAQLAAPNNTTPASPMSTRYRVNNGGVSDTYKRRNSVIGTLTHTQNYRACAVAMSTSHEPAFMRQAASLGAMNYLVKPISAETVHSLWLNVFSCRTHPHATGACCRDAVATATGGTKGANNNGPGRASSQTATSVGLMIHDNGGDACTLTPQQAIFQRRIRTDTVNGAFTADIRNPSFEEDFIRQFVPAISSTLPTATASADSHAAKLLG
ncbi:hypothetical protein GGI16_009410, partial [Coemansia sp. S142-1]